MTIKPIPVWLDCDPGTDDAFAILLLLFHPLFKLLGISTVHGNADLKSTTHNTLGLLEVMKVYNIPVYKGEQNPLEKAPFHAAYAHGESGLGGANLLVETRLKISTDKPYYEAIKDAVSQHQDEICIIATGAFTNLSVFFNKYPEIKSSIKYLPIMGAAFGFGNVTPYAEFNCFVDPKAANNLFKDPELQDKIIVSGLNITHTSVATEEYGNLLFDKLDKGVVTTMYENIMKFSFEHLYKKQGWAGPPIHDPLAVFCLLPVYNDDAKTFKFESLRKRVIVAEGGETDGQTSFVDGTKIEDNINEDHGSIIAKSIDIPLFYQYLNEALKNAELHVNYS